MYLILMKIYYMRQKKKLILYQNYIHEILNQILLIFILSAQQIFNLITSMLHHYQFFNFQHPNDFNQVYQNMVLGVNIELDQDLCKKQEVKLKIENLQDEEAKSHENKNINAGQRKTWTQEQDMKILQVIQTFNLRQYKKIPYKIIAKFLTNRSSKQIRERYLNKLDSKILETCFTQQEDQKIYKFYLENGPQWKKLSEIMKGRTNTALKNRFNVKLKQRLFTDPNLSTNFISKQKNQNNQTKIKSKVTTQILIKIENSES